MCLIIDVKRIIQPKNMAILNNASQGMRPRFVLKSDAATEDNNKKSNVFKLEYIRFCRNLNDWSHSGHLNCPFTPSTLAYDELILPFLSITIYQGTKVKVRKIK